MLYFNKRYVQVWDEKDVILLINHYWEGVNYFRKHGFKSIYQQVTRDELQSILRLNEGITENQYQQLVASIRKRVLERLIKYKFLIESNAEDASVPCDYSVAGDNLAPYMKSAYGIEQIMSPTKVQFLLTYRCFGNCAFCLTNSGHCTDVKEITDAEWEKIALRVCTELNPCQLDLIGGEPLLRYEALKKICTIATQKNVMVRIITNGVLLDDKKKCDELTEILQGYRHYIQISIDGNEKVHNSVRPGAPYSRIMNAIKNMSNAKLNWGVNITVTKTNVGLITEVFKEISIYKPIHFELGPLQTSIKDIDNCKKLVISKEEEGILRKQLKKLQEEFADIDITFNKREKIFDTGARPLGNMRKYQMCSAFEKLLAVGADARLIPCLRGCVHSEFFAENILVWEEDLKKLWRASKLRNIFQKIELKHKCKDCHYNQQCNQGCPLETYVLTGELGGFDPDCSYEQMS